MPNLENLKKQAKQLVRWHRDRNHSIGGLIRTFLPRYRDCSDNELLEKKFTLAMAQEIVARRSGIENWAELKSGVNTMSDKITHTAANLLAVYPQLFVRDVQTASAFYTDVLGFNIAYLHGEPPFYGQVTRDDIRMNLRFVHEPVFDEKQRDEERLLSAYIDVTGVKELYGEFKAAGAEIAQSLQRQPWGVHDFVVRDPDGNLLCFAEYE